MAGDSGGAPYGGALTEVVSFGANPGRLRMFRHVPEGLSANAPLVVALHGCGQNALGYAIGCGWIELADRYGFALLCPEQRAQNNFNTCFNWFFPDHVARGGGESESIREMIAFMIEDHAIDASRVFVSGLSAGGAMSVAMLAAYPELFAAGASICGLPYRSADNLQQGLGAMMQGRKRTPEEWGDKVRAASDHRGKWPRLSIWQGTDDRIVNPQNAEAIAQQWLNVQGLDAAQVKTITRGAITRSAWGRDDAPTVELNMIAGMGHAVPIALSGEDACGALAPYFQDLGVSSSLALVRAWGLTKPVPVPVAKPVKAPEPIRAPIKISEPALAFALAPSPGEQVLHAKKAKGGIDIGRVIKGALTAAGLMKR